MRDWKKIGKKIIFPPTWLIILLTIISTVALVRIFAKELDTSPLAYVSYVVSFYTLTIICAACSKTFLRCYKVVKSKL